MFELFADGARVVARVDDDPCPDVNREDEEEENVEEVF